VKNMQKAPNSKKLKSIVAVKVVGAMCSFAEDFDKFLPAQDLGWAAIINLADVEAG